MNSTAAKITAGFLFGAAMLFAGGCTGLLTNAQENALGARYAHRVDQQMIVFDEDYLSHLGHDLARCAPPRQTIHYRFSIICDSEVNAFSAPGGHIFINSGMVELAGNASEMAAVVAHEIAHTAMGHQKQVIASTMGLDLTNRLLMNENDRDWKIIVANGDMLKFDRAQEFEADDQAILMMWKANYDPNGLVTLFEKIVSRYGSGSSFFEIASLYPVTTERIERARAVIAQLPPRTGLVLDTAAFREFQSKVIREQALCEGKKSEGKK